MLENLYFKVCIYGGFVNRHWSNNLFILFFFTLTISSTFIAHVCDRLTYNYVKDNSFRKNMNQIGPTNDQNNIQLEDQELSEGQKELLKIPLNAVRISLMSFLPLMILPIIILIIGDNVLPPITKYHIGATITCMVQGSKIIVILTYLHKATEANQAEISQAKRRADMQEWERLNSFKAKQLRQQTQAQAQPSGPQPSTSSSASQDAGSLPPPRNQRQILDPEVLEAIMEEESSV